MTFHSAKGKISPSPLKKRKRKSRVHTFEHFQNNNFSAVLKESGKDRRLSVNERSTNYNTESEGGGKEKQLDYLIKPTTSRYNHRNC